MSNEAALRGMLNQAISERADAPVQVPQPNVIDTSSPDKDESVIEETPIQEAKVEREVPEEVEEVSEPVPQAAEQVKKGESNFRALRDKKRELERRNYELERYIEANLNQKPLKQEPIEELLPDPDDEGLVDGRQYKALKKEIHRYKQELQAEKQERTKALAEMKLLAKYPDVYDVVNRDTMEELMHVSPEEAATILNDPNPYTQHVSAYKAIKRYNIGADEPYLADRAKAKQNLAKPKPAAALPTKAANSALSNVENYYGPMSSEEKARLRKEMDDAINNRYR